MAGRNIGRARIYELAVDLVREEEQIVLLHHVAYAVHLLARVEISRRVVRVAYQYAARTLVYQLLEPLHLRQRKALLDRGRDSTYDRTRRDRKGHVIGIRRFRNDDLVSRVQTRHEGEQHSLRPSRRDYDILGRELYLVLVVIPHQFLAQRPVTVARTVFQHLAVYVAQRIQSLLRRRQIGLADVQMIYLDSAAFGGIGQRYQLADR